MKAWIGIHIISDKASLLDGIEGKLLNRLDDRLWAQEYNLLRGVVDGQHFVAASLFFNDFTDRALFKIFLGKLADYIEFIEPGSYIKAGKCYWDDLLSNGAPAIPDELEFEEVV